MLLFLCQLFMMRVCVCVCVCVRACVRACVRVCVCVVVVHWHCSAQLSMFNMEKRYRNKIIIIIIIIIVVVAGVAAAVAVGSTFLKDLLSFSKKVLADHLGED